jgi:iron complex outermembrane receptor protein
VLLAQGAQADEAPPGPAPAVGGGGRHRHARQQGAGPHPRRGGRDLARRHRDPDLVSEDPSALLALQVPGYAPSRQKLSSFGEGLRGRNALLLLDGIPRPTRCASAAARVISPTR